MYKPPNMFDYGNPAVAQLAMSGGSQMNTNPSPSMQVKVANVAGTYISRAISFCFLNEEGNVSTMKTVVGAGIIACLAIMFPMWFVVLHYAMIWLLLGAVAGVYKNNISQSTPATVTNPMDMPFNNGVVTVNGGA